MSDFTSKDHKGLLEAYHSIYNKKEEVVEELNESVEETLTEDYDVNILLENVKDYLVLRGYVDTEDQAYNIMSHMTEQFFGTLIGEMYAISACINMKEHLISEGCEVEDYTIEDMLNLFENYEKENLNEAVFTGTAAATSPLWAPAAAAALGGVGMYLQSRKKRPAKPVDYGQVKADIDAKEAEKAKNKPLSKKQQQEAERRSAREQGSQTPAPSKARTQNQPSSSETTGKSPASSSSSTPAPAPTPTPTPQPPKPPKGPGVFAKITDKFNKAMQNVDKYNKTPANSPNWTKNLPSLGQTGQNIKTGVTGLKNVVLGKTMPQFWTRVIGSGAVDQVGLSGAIGTKVNRYIQKYTQKSRAWGDDEKSKDIKQGAKEREEFRRRRENQNKPLDPSKYYTGDL